MNHCNGLRYILPKIKWASSCILYRKQLKSGVRAIQTLSHIEGALRLIHRQDVELNLSSQVYWPLTFCRDILCPSNTIITYIRSYHAEQRSSSASDNLSAENIQKSKFAPLAGPSKLPWSIINNKSVTSGTLMIGASTCLESRLEVLLTLMLLIEVLEDSVLTRPLLIRLEVELNWFCRVTS